MSDDERLRILELLEQGKITAPEAAELLSAISDEPRDMRRRGGERIRWVGELPPPTDRARWLRVRVTDQRTGRLRTNVSVPIGMIGFGLGFARRKFDRIPGMPGRALRDHIDDLFEAVRTGKRGVIFDVEGDAGERVEIAIE